MAAGRGTAAFMGHELLAEVQQQQQQLAAVLQATRRRAEPELVVRTVAVVWQLAVALLE